MLAWGGQKTRRRKNKNDHGSAVSRKCPKFRTFLQGDRLSIFRPIGILFVLPSHSTFNPCVRIWRYADAVAVIPHSRLGNTECLIPSDIYSNPKLFVKFLLP